MVAYKNLVNQILEAHCPKEGANLSNLNSSSEDQKHLGLINENVLNFCALEVLV